MVTSVHAALWGNAFLTDGPTRYTAPTAARGGDLYLTYRVSWGCGRWFYGVL